MRDSLAAVLSLIMLAGSGSALAQSDVAAPKLDDEGKIDCNFLRAHYAFLERGKDPGIRLLFIGDSITNGWQWGEHALLWDRYFGAYGPANFGIGGDRTEHVLWRIENGELDRLRPAVVVLLIGTNNIDSPADDVLAGVTSVVAAVRSKLPDAHLILMGIFPRAPAATNPKRAKIKAVNEGLARLAGGDRIRFLDIGERFLAPDGTLPRDIMPDALHLNHKGYQIWAEALKPLLEKMMTTTSVPSPP